MSEDRKAGIFFPPLNIVAREPPAESTFTFQYVSINTGTAVVDVVLYGTLHSNMFLLIPNAARYASQMGYAFTFQYVSINTFYADFLPGVDFVLYIPICFY